MPIVTITHTDGSRETVEGRVTAVTPQSVIVHTSQGDVEIRQVKSYQEQR